jgi:hypothetical protein
METVPFLANLINLLPIMDNIAVLNPAEVTDCNELPVRNYP